jgi:hypothetical protein
MFIKNFIDYLQSINEGLIRTNDGERSLRYTLDTLKKLKFEVEGQIKDDIISIKFLNFRSIDSSKIDDLFDMLSSLMTNKFGWFPSSQLLELSNGFNRLKKYDESEIKLKKSIISNLTIEYDSKFDEESKYDGELYHLSIQEYEKKILKSGLFPKSKSKLSSHIDRIYLCKSAQDCKNLIPQMKLHYSEERDINHYELGNKKWNKNTKWIIFKVNNTNLKLFKDPRYEEGYYTLDNISPSNISIFEKEI